MPGVNDCGRLAWEKDTKWGIGAFLLCWHHQPLRVMATAGEWHLTSDPPATIHPHCPRGRVKSAGYRRDAAGEQLGHAFGRQPGRVGGDCLVHHQIPRSRGIDPGDGFPQPKAVGRMQLYAAIGFWS
jgi:hypothetical protein